MTEHESKLKKRNIALKCLSGWCIMIDKRFMLRENLHYSSAWVVDFFCSVMKWMAVLSFMLEKSTVWRVLKIEQSTKKCL